MGVGGKVGLDGGGFGVRGGTRLTVLWDIGHRGPWDQVHYHCLLDDRTQCTWQE